MLACLCKFVQFYRYDGHHVWCLPQQKPDEYGFRRIARKPPFFKMRKQSFPKITREYSASHALNRTLQIEYNWNGYAALYHEFNDTVQEHMPGVRINAIQKSVDTTLKVMAEDGRVLFDAATDSYTDVHDLVKQCYRKMLEH